MKYKVEILTDTQTYNCFMEKGDAMEAWREASDTLAAGMPFVGVEGVFSIEKGASVKHIIVTVDFPAVVPVDITPEMYRTSPVIELEDAYTTYLGVKVQITLVTWYNKEKVYVLPHFLDRKPAYDVADPETITMLVNKWIEETGKVNTHVLELPPQQLPDIEEADAWLREKYPVKEQEITTDDAKAWRGWKGDDA